MKMTSGFYAVAATAILCVTPARAHSQDLGLRLGSAAPAAKLYTLDGKSADLSQFVGKTPALIEFWATWCENCQELEPTVIEAAHKYGKQVQFVGVAVSVNQTPGRVKAFVARHGLPGVQFYDTKGNATGAYNVPATSYVVVINKAGKVVYTGLGGKQDLDAAIRKAL